MKSVTLEYDDFMNYRTLHTCIINARVMLKKENILIDKNQEITDGYIIGVIHAAAIFKIELKKWWDKIYKKYDLPIEKMYTINIATGKLEEQ